MAEISGVAGSVNIGGTIAGIKAWSLDYVSEALETTDFGDSGHRNYIPGLDGWSGSFEGFKDGTPQSIGSEITLILREYAAASATWTGMALITGSHPAVDVDGIVGIAYDFQGSGVLKVPTV